MEFVTVLLLQESVIAVQKETIDVLSDKIEALQSKEIMVDIQSTAALATLNSLSHHIFENTFFDNLIIQWQCLVIQLDFN